MCIAVRRARRCATYSSPAAVQTILFPTKRFRPSGRSPRPSVGFNPCKTTTDIFSVVDLGCLSRIQDHGSDFFYPGSRIQVDKAPDPGSASASKNLSILTVPTDSGVRS